MNTARAARSVAPEIAVRQRAAADPASSVWVSASAGAGKTKVLTDRVLRLLLADTPPERILCLTFTRAAAAEMANRLNEVLGDWAVANDADLSAKLDALTGAAPDRAMITRARRLFVRVLDVPGGLRIQNFHSFCQALLARFPLEAGVAPHFRIMDDRTAAEMLTEARAAAMIDPGNAAALAAVAQHKGEEDFAQLMTELLGSGGKLAAALTAHGGSQGLARAVRAHLGLNDDETEEGVRAAFAAGADEGALKRAVAALAAGARTDKERAKAIASWLADPSARVSDFDAYVLVYLTKEGAIRKSLATADVLRAHPAIGESLGVEAARAHRAAERRRCAVVAEATAGLLALGSAVLARYEARKAAHARLDFDDLIQATERLLMGEGRAAWVLYKLDSGIEHVLVDEAQDTSPAQWRVVQALTGEFFAGEGARVGHRSVFAVGDPKQSIFSFQGADPAAFETVRETFKERSAAAGVPMAEVPLYMSFRSTPAVLAVVDAVFAVPAVRDGVSPVATRHEAHRAGAAGLVELWPVIGPADAADVEPWRAPAVDRRLSPPHARLAADLAARIRGWTESPEPPGDALLVARGRRMRAGDVMVLVRRRDAFVAALVRELKVRGVRVAGVDRMVLTEQLAVMDLVALGEVMLLPEDDLTLAAVLKSPLVGLNEKALFRLAYGRPGTLWDALRSGERDPEFARAHAYLSRLRARADFVRPYEFYADILNAGGRRNLLGRLGPDANDPIDEFMALALAFEREGAPSLQGFLHWLKAAETEVKRELEQAGGSVRVMTVHGSKGLQAPVVILPDTTGVPEKSPAILWEGDVPLWAPLGRWRAAPVEAALTRVKTLRDEEHRRLLYVAMTRAEDRLYVCGAHGKKGVSAGSWYTHVKAGLEGKAAVIGAGDGAILRFENPQLDDVNSDEKEKEPPDLPIEPWIHAEAPAEPAPPRPMAPSRPTIEPPVLSPLADDGLRFRRGLLVHRLLQILPDGPAADRPRLARAMLAREARDLGEDVRESLAKEVLAVLDAPLLAAAFGPHARAEVPLIGRVGGTVVAGQVDRLAVAEDSVTIIDYKTNRPPPARAEGTPAAYLLQLALYRALVRAIYPGRAVRSVIVWTDGCRVMPIADALIDAVEARDLTVRGAAP